MSEGGSSSSGWWIVGVAVVAFLVWWNIGMPGLQVKSGLYECKDSRGARYGAAVLDRDIQAFGRVEDGKMVTVAHKSVQRSSLTSSAEFEMAIEGGDAVTCTWGAELPGTP